MYSTYMGGNGEDQGFDRRRRLGERLRRRAHQVDRLPDAEPLPTDTRRLRRLRDDALASGVSLVYSTYLGGSADEGARYRDGRPGSAYVTGYTESTNFLRSTRPNATSMPRMSS